MAIDVSKMKHFNYSIDDVHSMRKKGFWVVMNYNLDKALFLSKFKAEALDFSNSLKRGLGGKIFGPLIRAKTNPRRINKECGCCGSSRVKALATVSWDVDKQGWIISELVDRSEYCCACTLPSGFKDVLVD